MIKRAVSCRIITIPKGPTIITLLWLLNLPSYSLLRGQDAFKAHVKINSHKDRYLARVNLITQAANTTCLVVGASGLIGGALVGRLAERMIVHGVSRTRALTHQNFFWHRTDLTHPLRVQDLPERVDTVVYLAQSEFFRDFPERATDVFAVNTNQLLHFLDYARTAGVKRFVFASSGGVYGVGARQFSEDANIPATGALGFYLSTNLCSEILVQNYSGLFSTVILRFFFVYGAGQRRSMLIPRLVDSVRAGNPIELRGDQGIVVNPTHVSDAVASIECALELDGSHTINIGGPDSLSLREIGEIIGRAVGKDPVFKINPDEGPADVVGGIEKMSRLLCAPRIAFADGLRAVL